MTKLEMIKMGVGITASLGSGIIIGSIVRNNVPQRNLIEKTVVFTGALAIGGLVGDQVRKHTDGRIDEIAAWLDKNTKK